MRSRNGQLFLLHRRWMKLEDLKILNECTQPAENERLEIRLWTMAWAVGLLSSFFSLFFTLNGFNCFSEEQHYSHITTCTERECEARSSPAINNLFSLLQETSRKKSPRRWHTYTKTFFSAVLLSHKHTLFNLSFLTNISHFSSIITFTLSFSFISPPKYSSVHSAVQPAWLFCQMTFQGVVKSVSYL